MAMPETLVLVRHGLSEPNIVQRLEKHVLQGSISVDESTGDYQVHDPYIQDFADRYMDAYWVRDEIYARPDSEQRLSLEGVEQAKKAGMWLTEHMLAPAEFDERYVSPFNRTIDTALALGGACTWLADYRIVERDWGLYGATPRDKRPDMFPHTDRMKERASFYVRYDNGESILDVALRVRDWVDTLDRDDGDKKVLAVCHGETMWTTRFVFERMLPQEYQDLDGDTSLRIGNCCILILQRTNPDDPEERVRSLSSGWRRMIDPVEPEKSPYDGEWHRLPGKRRFSAAQLGDITARTERLIV